MAKPIRFKPYRENVSQNVINTQFSAFISSLLQVTTAANLRTDIGLNIGSDVQAYDEQLEALAALSDVGLLIYLQENDLGIGDTIQAHHANLDTLAGLSDVNTLVALEASGVPIVAEFISSGQTITSAGSLTLAHGLDVTPVQFAVELVCTDAGGDAGYAQNDLLQVPHFIVQDAGGDARGVSIVPDGTNLNIRFADTAATFQTANKSTGAIADLTNSKWNAIFKAWA